MSAEDLINRVKQRRLNKPTSDLPPTYPPYPTYPVDPNAPTTTTPPDRPSLILPYQPTGQIAAEAAKGGNDKGFLGNLLSIPGSAVKGVFTGIGQLPQLGKDIVMTGVGTAE